MSHVPLELPRGLFDPIAPDTPARIQALVKKLPDRIVALRTHKNLPAGKPATTSGVIRDRDLHHPAMKESWRAAQSLGLAIQMHFIPRFAPQIGELASEFRDTPVILDHLARAAQGTPAEFEQVLKLSQYPRVHMKYSAVNYSSKQQYSYADAKPIVQKAFDAFGADRIFWGGLGMNMPAFQKAAALLDQMFDYASESDRAKIRGLNAMKLFRFT